MPAGFRTPKIVQRDQIESVLPSLDLATAMEDAFIAYSNGEAVIPPVGELLLERGDVHIKYGCIRGRDHFVVKVASGFHRNPELGISASQGLMILFSQRTGEPVCLLLDGGLLTDARTAAAGAVAAKHLAPRRVFRIGVVGTGIQARLQLRFLLGTVDCPEALVWGRGRPQLEQFRQSLADTPLRIETTRDLKALQRGCNLIVTATPATQPLLHAADLRPDVHITAVGSDTAQKQELDAKILGSAHLVVADSLSQCLVRGEIHKAVAASLLDPDTVVELGEIISGRRPGRTSDDQITVADLTGVAVQDLLIAEAVHQAIG